MRSITSVLAIISVLFCCVTADAAVVAKKKNAHIHKKPKQLTSQSITESPKYAGLVVNAETAEIMYSRNAKAQRYPASLTKMMTIYLTFEALKAGKLRMNDVLTASKHAASQQRTNLDLKPGSKITVREAIYGLVVRSANDAAVVLGEHIAGSEDAFVNIMNAKAKSLGLRDTRFCNPHGLHNDKQVTTAYDMALLTLAMQKHFPQYYHMLSKTSFTYNGKLIKGHNKVLERYRWANGGKTGYIRASGYNIVTSTRSPDGKLVAVVMGGQQGKRGADRDEHTIQLLQNAYNTIKAKKARS